MTFEPQAAVIELEREAPNPPFVVDVLGEQPNGRAIALRIQRSEEGPVDLCLRSEDVQYFVSLILGGPVTAINVGQTTDDENFVMLDVGVVSLTFGLRQEYLEEVGRTLLGLSARAPSGPS